MVLGLPHNHSHMDDAKMMGTSINTDSSTSMGNMGSVIGMIDMDIENQSGIPMGCG